MVPEQLNERKEALFRALEQASQCRGPEEMGGGARDDTGAAANVSVDGCSLFLLFDAGLPKMKIHSLELNGPHRGAARSKSSMMRERYAGLWRPRIFRCPASKALIARRMKLFMCSGLATRPALFPPVLPCPVAEEAPG